MNGLRAIRWGAVARERGGGVSNYPPPSTSLRVKRISKGES